MLSPYADVSTDGSLPAHSFFEGDDASPFQHVLDFGSLLDAVGVVLIMVSTNWNLMQTIVRAESSLHPMMSGHANVKRLAIILHTFGCFPKTMAAFRCLVSFAISL